MNRPDSPADRPSAQPLTEMVFHPSRETVVSKASWRWGAFLALHLAVGGIAAATVLFPGGLKSGGEIAVPLVLGLMLFTAWTGAHPRRFPRALVAKNGLLHLPYPQRRPAGKKRWAVPLADLREGRVEEKDGLRFRFLLVDESKITIHEDALEHDEMEFLQELLTRLG